MMMRRIRMTSAAAYFLSCLSASAVFESARPIPVAAETDVLVVGGTAASVSAATAAAEKGTSRFAASSTTAFTTDSWQRSFEWAKKNRCLEVMNTFD